MTVALRFLGVNLQVTISAQFLMNIQWVFETTVATKGHCLKPILLYSICTL